MAVKQKSINLALQGGGSHGAFTWGVLDRLLEDRRIRIDGICGTSAGAMNAIVCAYGNLKGGPDRARELLHDFWRKISLAGERFSPVRNSPFDAVFNDAVRNASYALFDTMTRALSPYQLNPLNFNPLREVLEDVVKFDELKNSKEMRVFVCATNVRTGKPKVFHNDEVTADAVGVPFCSPANPTSLGAPAEIRAFGSNVAGGNPLAIVASGLPSSSVGYFLCSRTTGSAMPPSSQGVLCLGGNIGRISVPVLAVASQGRRFGRFVDTLALPGNPPTAVSAGQTWYFQAWFRDSVGGSATSNFTDAVAILFK